MKTKFNDKLEIPKNIHIIKQKLKWFAMKNFSWLKKFNNQNERHRIWSEKEIEKIRKEREFDLEKFHELNNHDKTSLSIIRAF